MIKLFGKTYPIRKLLFFGGEGLYLLLSLVAVVVYRNGGDLLVLSDLTLWLRLLLIVMVCLLAFYYHDLYTFRAGFSYPEMTTRLVQAMGGASILLGFLYFAVPTLLPGRWVFLSSLLLFAFLSGLWRYAYCWVLRQGYWTRPVLVVGAGQFPKKILDALRDHPDCGYRVAGLALERMPEEWTAPNGMAVFRSFDSLHSRVRELGVAAVIVAMDERRGSLPVGELLDCKVNGVPVLEGESFFEELTGRIMVEKINPSWLIFHEGFQKSWLMLAGKRIIGMVFSASGLFLSLPVLLVTALGIRLESEGPVFFRQVRVGKGGRPFTLVKFRSMRVDAEVDGARWAGAADDRVTRIGRWIRRMRIDEIPQMWNVLRGDMNFVGPRPERPEFVGELREKIPYYDQRHSVKPGITGWAQINFPYGASVEDAKRKLEYDLYYIKHMSVLLDLYIILKTVKTILFREGSR